ncbi:hypothetical protein RHSIM_Rhsim07G0149500 [Rhododendron simsii]|uniref:Aminotransferase-like plant mobile domain-containing protein n=1 Tax=Rhododendron simsii TaxID=118357 RepID=A0A834GTW3_RHOSS|nr:hypothetical protein RHSIM_Rhsim07G0149500 [Rhododendron simsii]
MAEADKAPYIHLANEAMANKPKKKRKPALTRTLEFGRLRAYEITTADVAQALGLKLGSVPVLTKCEDEHVKHIQSLFLEKEKKLTRGLAVKMMDVVFEKKTSGKKFKTAYVLFALCCFLCPTTKDEAGPKLFPCVMDLHAIPNYAWPQFVLDWLLLYFDKEQMDMTVGEEGGSLIECWTQQRLQERIKKEENLELLDPTLSQFPQPRLRHPIKKKDDILMEALENKPSGHHESTSDVQNKPSGEQSESDGGSESDESDGGEKCDESDRGEESDEVTGVNKVNQVTGVKKVTQVTGMKKVKEMRVVKKRNVHKRISNPRVWNLCLLFPEIANQGDMPIYMPEHVTIHNIVQAGISGHADERHVGQIEQGEEELDQ